MDDIWEWDDNISQLDFLLEDSGGGCTLDQGGRFCESAQPLEEVSTAGVASKWRLCLHGHAACACEPPPSVEDEGRYELSGDPVRHQLGLFVHSFSF